jgi:FkbM family methyltransferase
MTVHGRLAALFPPVVAAGPGVGLRIARAGASADYRRGTNELPVQAALADHLRPGGVFFDIGANVGFFSLLAARLVGPGGRVVAFEPVPALAARVRANARRNRLATVAVLEVAVSDAAGATFLVLAAHPGGAALAAAAPPPDATGTIEVATAAVDDLVAAGRVPPPTVVKIDVEGAEAAVLRGMARTLLAHRPVVVCEVDGPDAAAMAARRSAVVGLLEAAGYAVEVLPPSYPGSAWCVEHLLARPGGRAR